MTGNVINWPNGLQPLRTKIRQHADIILSGTVLAIDPSSGSSSSMPGFSIWLDGGLFLSGIIKLDPKKAIGHRLTTLYHKIQELTDARPDVLVVESINKMQAHEYLLYAVGVTMAAADAPVVISVHNSFWKSVAKATPDYKKSDSEDAIMLGRSVILFAKQERDKE